MVAVELHRIIGHAADPDRIHLAVGLADLDPLSDVASLLDLYESEQALAGTRRREPRSARSLQEYVLPAFRGLDILFPMQKLGIGESGRVMEMIYSVHLAEIDRRYDLLLFDMPAGLGYEAAGTVEAVDPASGTLQIKTDAGKSTAFTLGPETVLIRNKQPVSHSD